MCASPISSNYIAVGSSDSHIRIYDRRYLSLIDFNGPNSSTTNNNTVPVKTFTIPSYEKRPFRVTSIKYSSDESELLVSYSSDHLYLFDVTKEGINVKNPDESSKRSKRTNIDSPPTVRRLRLRGDWSDTGPQARPEREAQRVTVGQARPQLQATIMHRMTEVLSRMLADPRTRIGLSAHGNEIADHRDFANSVQQFQNIAEQGTRSLFASFVATVPVIVSISDNLPNSSNSMPGMEPINEQSRQRESNATGESNQQSSSSSHDQSNETRDIDIVPYDSTTMDWNVSDIDMEQLNTFDYMKMKFVGHRNAR